MFMYRYQQVLIFGPLGMPRIL
eukprot:SAG11_NODE_36378_length_261_cov_47.265432_1_plen_21_part_01